MFLRAAGKRKQQLFCTFETVKNNLREKKKIFYQVITPFMRTLFVWYIQRKYRNSNYT